MISHSTKYEGYSVPLVLHDLSAHEKAANSMLFTTQRQIENGRFVKYYIRGFMLPRTGLLHLLEDGGLVLSLDHFPIEIPAMHHTSYRDVYVTKDGAPLFPNFLRYPTNQFYHWRFPSPGEKLYEAIE